MKKGVILMSERTLYQGPDFGPKNQKADKPGEYTVIEQSQSFGIPEEELKTPPAGLSKTTWGEIMAESK